MYKALYYKEWYKTRRMVILGIILMLATLAYSFINLEQMFRLGGATGTWSNIMLKDMPILPSIVQWMPLAIGVLLALAQFIPEMTDKRLKLTLHLPLGENKIMSALLGYGVITLLALFVASYIILLLICSCYFPSEIMGAMIYKSIPWFGAGIVGYLLVSWVCLEPTWSQRIRSALISLAIISVFFIGAKSGAYIGLNIYLLIVMVAAFLFPFYSISRFKEGAL